MEYKMIGFNENEFLRIGMDGHTLSLNNTDSIDWQKFTSVPIVTQGVHSLDIAILSNFEELNSDFKSKAQVLIKSISF